MDWRDTGVLLAVRRHGENNAIAEIFTAEHGRHTGVIRGASSRRVAPALQPGTQLDVTWRARLEAHMGSFTVEPLQSRAAKIMSDRLALAGLGSVAALLVMALPERDPQPRLYAATIALLDLMCASDDWPLAYLRWERLLLEEMGFGLDLDTCAATGATEDLIYVSPRSGRAVSRRGAGAWANRLLPLPKALLDARDATLTEIQSGLTTTGHFIETRLVPELGQTSPPEARRRLLDAIQRKQEPHPNPNTGKS